MNHSSINLSNYSFLSLLRGSESMYSSCVFLCKYFYPYSKINSIFFNFSKTKMKNLCNEMFIFPPFIKSWFPFLQRKNIMHYALMFSQIQPSNILWTVSQHLVAYMCTLPLNKHFIWNMNNTAPSKTPQVLKGDVMSK